MRKKYLSLPFFPSINNEIAERGWLNAKTLREWVARRASPRSRASEASEPGRGRDGAGRPADREAGGPGGWEKIGKYIFN